MNRVPIWVWFVIPTIIIIVIGSILITKVSEKPPPENQNAPEQISTSIEGVEEFEIPGREHITQGTKATNHNSNPPTSGSHWPEPIKNGIYDKPIPDEQAIHNLEHGYVWITYKSDTPSEIVDNLKKIVEEDNWKIIMSERDENETQIVLVAWGRLLKFADPDYEKIKKFIKVYRNRGPERTPD